MTAEEQHDRQTAELARRFEAMEQQQQAWTECPTEGWEVELLKARNWL